MSLQARYLILFNAKFEVDEFFLFMMIKTQKALPWSRTLVKPRDPSLESMVKDSGDTWYHLSVQGQGLQAECRLRLQFLGICQAVRLSGCQLP